MLQVNSPNKDQIKQNTFFKCAFAIHPGFVCLLTLYRASLLTLFEQLRHRSILKLQPCSNCRFQTHSRKTGKPRWHRRYFIISIEPASWRSRSQRALFVFICVTLQIYRTTTLRTPDIRLISSELIGAFYNRRLSSTDQHTLSQTQRLAFHYIIMPLY